MIISVNLGFFQIKVDLPNVRLGFGNKSDFDLKNSEVGFAFGLILVKIWSDKSLILRFLALIFCLAALERDPKKKNEEM